MKYVFVDFDETMYLHVNKPFFGNESLYEYLKTSGGLLNKSLINILQRAEDCQFFLLSHVASVEEIDAKKEYLEECVPGLFTSYYGSGGDKAGCILQWCMAQNINPVDCILIDDNAAGCRGGCYSHNIAFYTPQYLMMLNWLPT